MNEEIQEETEHCVEETQRLDKPTVRLIGQDGNAFAILGACQRAARKARWSEERIKTVLDEMRSGDYDNLLATACKYFDVE